MEHRLRRPNGGFKRHIVPLGQHTAVCGYAPSSPKGHMIRGRGHWADVFPFDREDPSICQQCLEKLHDNLEPGNASTQ
jgi:hypothetical protein